MRRRASAFLVLLVLTTTAAGAQSWAGQGHLNGLVQGRDEQPLADAQVRLTPVEAPEQGPDPVATDRSGRWKIGGLAQGRWRLFISAEGYIRSEGWAVVGPTVGPPIEVTLRPLTEVLPGFAENPGSVYGWLEKGNALLEQGRPAEARAEYERALKTLPRDQHPEILRTVARTYYLEKDVDGAINALKHALLVAAQDDDSRALFQALLDGLGRGEEARAWLARLDRDGAEALVPEVELPPDSPTLRPPPPAYVSPPLPPLAGRVGSYRTAFAERSRLSSFGVYVERHQADREGIEAIDADPAGYEISDETFEVFVPESYDSALPHGLLVWVSPTPSGKIRRPDNLKVLSEKRLIWVGADNSGNRRRVWDRVGLALDAAHSMSELYNIDPHRVYVGGYSGGGRISTALSVLYPDVFEGGLLFMGCDYYRDVPMPDKPGAHWPAAFARPPGPAFRLARERNRYVFATGENDFNRMQTKVFHRLYKKDGFRHATYLEIPGANHYSGFSGEWLAKFVDALDNDSESGS